MKIECAPRNNILLYHERLEEMVRDLFGIGGCFLTDESQLRDFPIEEDTLERLWLHYGVDAKPEDTMLSIAERIWGRGA